MLRIFQEVEGKTDANRKNQQFNINEDFDLGFISRSITYNDDEAIPDSAIYSGDKQNQPGPLNADNHSRSFSISNMTLFK
mgnify:CR=1 FL=1